MSRKTVERDLCINIGADFSFRFRVCDDDGVIPFSEIVFKASNLDGTVVLDYSLTNDPLIITVDAEGIVSIVLDKVVTAALTNDELKYTINTSTANGDDHRYLEGRIEVYDDV